MSDSQQYNTTHEQQEVDIANNFRGISGINFVYSEGRLRAKSPSFESTMSDEELIRFGEENMKVSYDDHKEEMTYDEYIEDVITTAKRMVERTYIGGYGITDRTEEQVDEEIPGVIKRIEDEKGKIAFLGNGFSSAPIRFAQEHREGIKAFPPVIVDLFEYTKALEDLTALEREYINARIEFPLAKYLDNVRNIVEYINSGDLIQVKYRFGSDDLPLELHDINLAINCFGPPSNTIDEQLQILATGGQLYIDYEYLQLQNDTKFVVADIEDEEHNTKASVITKL